MIATASVQGMVKGQVYTITDVNAKRLAFGTFVTYTLDNKLQIANGHMLLNRA